MKNTDFFVDFGNLREFPAILDEEKMKTILQDFFICGCYILFFGTINKKCF